MTWLRNLLLHNWWLKLLSLGLAYALWAVVIPTESGPVETWISAPLQLANIPPRLQVVGEVPLRVHLQLRGTEARLHRLLPEEVIVVLNLRRAAAGNHVFRLTPDSVQVPLGVQAVRIVPEEIRLELARR